MAEITQEQIDKVKKENAELNKVRKENSELIKLTEIPWKDRTNGQEKRIHELIGLRKVEEDKASGRSVEVPTPVIQQPTQPIPQTPVQDIKIQAKKGMNFLLKMDKNMAFQLIKFGIIGFACVFLFFVLKALF